MPKYTKGRSALRHMQCAVFPTLENTYGSFYTGEKPPSNNDLNELATYIHLTIIK